MKITIEQYHTLLNLIEAEQYQPPRKELERYADKKQIDAQKDFEQRWLNRQELKRCENRYKDCKIPEEWLDE